MSGSSTSGGGNTSVLREFLMKLGYAEDEQSRRKFGDAIKTMTTTIAGLGAAVTAAALGVVAGVRQMSEGMAELHFVSQRTGSTVADIRTLQGAFSSLGGTAGEARGAMEGLAQFIRENPAGKTYIESWTKVPYEGAAKGVEQLSDAFKRLLAEGMNPATLLKLGESFGLTTQQVLVMLQDNFKQVVDAYRKLDQEIGGKNQDVMAKNAVDFNLSYNLILAALNKFAMNFNDDLSTKLKPLLDEFRDYLVAHQKEILDFLESASKAIVAAMHVALSVMEDIGTAIKDLTGWYKSLTPEGKATAEAITAVATAIVLLNTRLFASPLGILIALGTALSTLYEDYKKWKADPNADTLIDWNKWAPDMEAALKAINEIASAIDTIVTSTVGWQRAAEALLLFMAGRWALGIVAAVTKAIVGVDAAVSGSLLWRFAPLLGLLAFAGPAGPQASQEEEKKADDDLQKSQAGGSVMGNWIRSNAPTWMGGAKPGEPVNPVADQTMDDVQRNFLNTLAQPESQGDYRKKQGGSEFGGNFEEFPDYIGPKGTSTASGRYQFTRDTWKEIAGILHLKDFSPENQDKAAWYLAEREYKQKSGGRDLRTDWQDPTRRADIAGGLYGRWPSTTKWANAPPTSITPKEPPVVYDQLGRPMKPGQTSSSSFFVPDPSKPPDTPAATTPDIYNTFGGTPDLSRLTPNFVPPPGTNAAPVSNDNSNVALHQTNNITVNTGNGAGSADPNHIANTVAQQVQQNTAQIVRNGLANVR